MLARRQRLRKPIRCVKNGITYEALVTGLFRKKCLLVFPHNPRPSILPGEWLELEIPSREEGVKRCQVRAARVRGRNGHFCLIKNAPFLDQMEWRTARRIPVNLPSEYCSPPEAAAKEAFQHGRIVNLSKTGLLLAAAAPQSPGSSIVLMFDLKWEDIEVPVGVLGTIVREQALVEKHHKAFPYGYGVQFTSPRIAV